MRVTDEMVEVAARAMAETIAKRHGHDAELWLSDSRREDARAALEAALAVEGTEAQAKPVAFLVDDFHVARSPVKARGKFSEPDHYLYPAKREADARDAAKIMGGTCTPLYTTPPTEGIPKVKALEWGEYKALGGGTKLVAHDCFGNEFARLDLAPNQTASSIQIFKHQKQADYEKRVLSCLELAPAPVPEAKS